jgi:hypothetical protein
MIVRAGVGAALGGHAIHGFISSLRCDLLHDHSGVRVAVACARGGAGVAVQVATGGGEGGRRGRRQVLPGCGGQDRGGSLLLGDKDPSRS